ncbi:unknown [Clostridium sp. CAG:524]|nr:unknown [Clostridium sp. CAG:524]
MENYHNFDKINNKKSLKIRDFVDFIGANVVGIYNFFPIYELIYKYQSL